MKSTIKELLLMLVAVLLFSIPAWAGNPGKDSVLHVHGVLPVKGEDIAYMRAMGLPAPAFLSDSCAPAACRTFRDPDLYQVYAALAQEFVFSGDTCTPAVCRPFRDPDLYQVYAAIKGISLGGSAWLLNGNTVGAEKWHGTIDNYDLPFRTNNVERMRILKTGAAVIGHTATAIGEKLGIKTASDEYGWTHTDGTIKLTSFVGQSAGWLGTQSNHSLYLFYNDGGAMATVGTVGSLGIAARQGMLIASTANFLVGNRFAVHSDGTLVHGTDLLSTGYAFKVRNNGGTDADNILVVQNNKMVGINTGTATVTEELEVVGDAKITGNVTSATWQGVAVGTQYGGTGADNSTNAAGSFLRSNGANGSYVASTLILPNTATSGRFAYSDAANSLAFSSTSSFDGNNAGFGTTTPDIYSLGVAGRFVSIQTTNANDLAVLTLAASGTGNAALNFGNATIRRASISAQDGSRLAMFTNSTNAGTGLTEKWRIAANGNLSNTVADGTAYIHLKAGTASASTAPLKFTSGTDNATAEAGAMEFGSSRLAFTPSGTTRKRVLLSNDAAPTNGQIPIGNGTDLTMANITSSGGSITITNGAGTIDLATTQALASGTYTPTLTNVANLDASTAYQCQYMRVGNTVTVSGRIAIDPTAGSASTQLGISLPIASAIELQEEVGGTAAASAIAGQSAAILGDAANDRAQLQFISGDTSNQPMFFSFTYKIN